MNNISNVIFSAFFSWLKSVIQMIYGAVTQPEHLSLLTFHLKALAGNKLSTAVGDLHDYRSLGSAGSFDYGIDGIGANAVNGRNGKTMLSGNFKNLVQILSGNYTRLYKI